MLMESCTQKGTCHENFAYVFPRNKESSVLEQSADPCTKLCAALLLENYWLKMQNPAQKDGKHLFQLHKSPTLPPQHFLTTITFLIINMGDHDCVLFLTRCSA